MSVAPRLAQPAASQPGQDGRPRLPRLPQKPGTRRWQLLLAQDQAAVQTVADEMEAYYQDRSDQWQGGDRGEAFMERLEAVQQVVAAFNEVPNRNARYDWGADRIWFEFSN